MKILHLCLANFYIDNYSYQENILTKFHKKLGHEVEIIASLVSFDKNGKPCLLDEGSHYINEHGIPVTRLEYQNHLTAKRLRRYNNTYKEISRSNPDIIFIHGCQFLDVKEVVKYVKQKMNVKVYVDNHADFSNSARNWLSKNILHKIIWRKCAHLIEPYTSKFYGVLPARVDFLRDIYKIPADKIELLVMGADDDMVKNVQNPSVRKEIRKKNNIKESDFLIITGGKIDNAKRQTLLLMKAVSQIKEKKIKLIVFGSIINELKKELEALVDNEKIQYIGWIESEESYNYFAAADLAVFPGRHSVLWEQAVGTGIPCVFKFWEGTTHVDVGGNCDFLYEDSTEEIRSKLIEIYDSEKYISMLEKAKKTGIQKFSYYNIAQKSITCENNQDL